MAKGAKSLSKGQPRTAFQLLQQQLKWVDLVIEVLDARAPLASRHPRHDKIFGNKPRLIVLTKSDLADPKISQQWVSTLPRGPHQRALCLSLKEQKRQGDVVAVALELTEEKKLSIERKGLLPRAMRVCVVGMPNVGKSSLINWLIGRKQVKVADRPGVTRGPQWIRVHPKLELLDTPGILPPVSSSKDAATGLAIFNLTPPGTYDPNEVAERALIEICRRYPASIERYLSWQENNDGQELLTPDRLSLDLIAERKHFITTGGRLDAPRAAAVFLADIRNGRVGRITLDWPKELLPAVESR
ncbi:MAG TPA: ribosome biogenesis GTPase YlqF [Candidatus Obscuribacterales bacterium]